MKLFRNILALVLAGLLFILPVLLLGGSIVLNSGRFFFGYRFSTGTGESMEPNIMQDDKILIRACPPEDIKAGDVIAYALGGDIRVVHRVIRVVAERNGEQGLWFVTKGDNNAFEDPPVPAEKVLGRMVGRYPLLGKALARTQGHRGILGMAMFLLTLLCFGMGLYIIIKWRTGLSIWKWYKRLLARMEPHRPGSPPAPRKVSRGRRILALVLAGFLFLLPVVMLLGGTLLLGMSRDPSKVIFGFKIYTVLTQSMAPAVQADGTVPNAPNAQKGGFYAGDAVIIKLCPPEAVKVGDIITFNPNIRDPESGVTLSHRVVLVMEERGGEPGIWFVTKGDNNTNEDPPITADMLVGKVVGRLPKIGRLTGDFALAPLVVFLALPLCWGAAIVLLILPTLRGRRGPRRQPLRIDASKEAIP